MFDLQNVTKVYPNQVVALSGVTLRIERGEFVFLVGASGAGKSTLVKLLYREELPTRGRLFFNGRNITGLRASQVPYLRRRVGVVFQDCKLLPHKTAQGNVAFALEVTGAGAYLIRRRVPAVLELVGLADKARAYPHELSGGEQQRVALARAIVNNPSVVIADEPTGNLDPQTAWEIVRLLGEINRRGRTVIMATHAKAIVNRMGKRVVALDRGRIFRDDENGVYDDGLL
ncbi:MAG: cell division ATP-binding protein FtsE [bacterium]|nr:cell division ATP-binding protein FtsE [bacterium]